jgi:(2Fe-2S) ferredoxin
MADPLHPIVNLLREQGRLDDLQVEEIVQEHTKTGKPVQQIIADAGYV